MKNLTAKAKAHNKIKNSQQKQKLTTKAKTHKKIKNCHELSERI